VGEAAGRSDGHIAERVLEPHNGQLRSGHRVVVRITTHRIDITLTMIIIVRSSDHEFIVQQLLLSLLSLKLFWKTIKYSSLKTSGWQVNSIAGVL